MTEHAGTLLADPAEAALEHLVDVNPGRVELVMHLGILEAARAQGIAQTYAAIRTQERHSELAGLLDGWLRLPSAKALAFIDEHSGMLLTDEAEGMLEAGARGARDPRLVAVLGLLGLCRLDGIEQAHAQRDGEPVPPPDDEEPTRALALARLHAGMRPGDAELQADHAVAAAAQGKPEEAAGAIAACRDAADVWERKAIDRRLAATAAARPQLADDIDALRRALEGVHLNAAGSSAARWQRRDPFRAGVSELCPHWDDVGSVFPMEAKIDSVGRIVVPKPLRDELGLTPGSTVDISRYGAGLQLLPTARTARLVDESGVLVAVGDTMIDDGTVFDLIDAGRR